MQEEKKKQEEAGRAAFVMKDKNRDAAESENSLGWKGPQGS